MTPEACLRRGILAWHDVEPPSAAALRALTDLAATMRSLQAVREAMAFEDEPASFAVVLRELAD